MVLWVISSVLAAGLNLTAPVWALAPLQSSGSPAPDEMGKLRDELDRLRQDNRQLQTRAVELEAALTDLKNEADSLHQLLQQTRVEAEQEAARARKATDFVSTVLSRASGQDEDGRRPSVQDVLEHAAAGVPRAPAEESWVRETLARTYLEMGETARARDLLERVVQERTERLGPDDLETRKSTEALLECLLKEGKDQEAEELLRKLLDLREIQERQRQEPDRGGEDPRNQEQAKMRLALGRLLMERGDYGKAEDELKAAEEMLQRNPGDLEVQSRLAQALQEQGKVGESLTRWRALVDGLRRERGEDDAEYLRALREYAAACARSGQGKAALDLLHKALSGQNRVLGSENAETLATAEMLARMAAERGELAQALELEQKVLESRKKVLGEQHPATLRAMTELAGTLLSLGDVDRSRQLLQQALEAEQKVVGDGDDATRRTKVLLIQALEAAGRAQEAQALRATLGPEPAPPPARERRSF